MDQATTEATPASLRRQIDQNRLDERQKYLQDLKRRSELSPEDLARYLNRKCAYCGAYLTPSQIPDEWRGPGNYLTVWPDSHDCEAERQALVSQAVAAVQDQAEAWNKDYQKRLKDSGLVGWLGGATFDSFEPRSDWAEAMAARERVMAYVTATTQGQREKPFLILYGKYGNGKSHLAAASVRWFVDLDWKRCYFRVWPDYLKRIQATFKNYQDEVERETEGDIIAELQAGAFTVIDDLDKRRPSDFVRDTLFEVLNRRYNAQLPTILTFNYGPGDKDPAAPGRLALEAYMGRAVLDRLLGATFDVIEFTGPSYRSGLEWGAK